MGEILLEVLIMKKSFLVVGVGINTYSSPSISNFETSSLQSYTKKKINNKRILMDIKKTYEMFVKDLDKYKFLYLKRKYK